MLRFCPNCNEEVEVKHGICTQCGEELIVRRKTVIEDEWEEENDDEMKDWFCTYRSR